MRRLLYPMTRATVLYWAGRVIWLLWEIMKFEWGPKVAHYAARTVNIKSVPGIESIAAEILVVFLLIIFAVRAWEIQLLLLLVPCALGVLLVSVTLVPQICLEISNGRHTKAKTKESEET